ncbi:PREDICTED: uncharacterized protein LOC106815784 [Priapulus caudatus]|uniref:Uncharacterized protein LOC106815784 n=1 Tax=Priapulus caudatus TaxID=37621 RepID=A0ABM1EUA7_PRICU|nr:PREDICTED: uncharacterized protein LOC106815784 [Priapulus caudatus]
MIGDTWEYFPTCCNVIANLVAFGLYKKVLASNDTEQQSDSAASPQSAIIVQDISSGVILRRFQQLTNSIISCCKFSENGEFVLSYSLGEDKIRMWNIDTEELYSTEISVPNSTHLDFHVVDNDCLIIHSISGDQQTIVNVWRDGTVIEIIRYVGEVPIGVYYVPAVERAVIVEPGDNRWAAKSMKVSLINPWSSEPQNIERVLDSTEESFMSYLGGVIGLLVTSKEDQLDRLVYRAGKRVGSYRMNDVMTATHVSRDDVDTAGDKFYDSVFTSNGSMLVLQTIYKDAGKIKLDLLDSKTIVKSSPMANTVEMPESDYAVFRLKPIISNDDTMVLVDSGRSKLEVGRSKIYVWNMETGKIRKLANPSISDGDYHIKCFSFSPDSRMIFVSFKQALVNEDAVDVFNADYASYVKQYTNRGAFILYMEPKQQEAATYTSKGKLCFWNWESGEMKHTNEAHSVISHGITNRDSLAMPAAWHQASEKIAVVQVDYKYVRLLLYDMRKREAKELSGAEVEDPDGEYDYPYSYVLAFSPDSDGSVLATSVASGGITLWNTRRFTKQVVLDCEVPIFVTGAWLSTTQLIVLQGGDTDFAVRILTFCSSAARPSLNNVVVENYVAVPSESMATVAPSRDALAIVKENVGLLLLSFNGFVKSDAAVATAAYVLGVK